MEKRKALTLLEIIVSVACMSLLVICMYQIINNTVVYTVSGVNSVKAQDEIKQITETLRINVTNATEMYILENEPAIKDDTYQYFYTRDGVVYYYDMEENVIDISDKVANNIKFEGDDVSKILKYTVSASRGNDNKESNSSIYIQGLVNGLNKPKNVGSLNSGNCIMFRVHSDTSVITNFVLNNDNDNPTLDVPVRGMIQDGVINVYVPKNPNKTNKKYTPTVTFVGDRVVVSSEKLDTLEAALDKQAEDSNGYELEKREIDFVTPVYYYVISNENIKEYEVNLIVGDVNVEIYQDGRNGATITDIIRFDKTFKVSGINTFGTLQWFTEGRLEPVKVVEISATNTDLTLTPAELYAINDNVVEQQYEDGSKSKYEDAMRYITVKFTPTVGGESVSAAPKLIYPISENAETQLIGKTEDDFYFKVATDVWIESKGKDTFVDATTGKTGADAIGDFKAMYKIASGEEYKSVAKLNANQAPNLVRVMYQVKNGNVIEPRIFAFGDTATYSRTVFGVDLLEYGIPNDMLDSYEVSATYSDSGFKQVNGVDTVNVNNNGNLNASMSIGMFADEDMNGFRAIAGVNAGKGYVKSVNYKDNTASEGTAFSNINIMQEYVLNSTYTLKDQNPITFSVKAFRQDNDDSTILYYANVEDNKGIRVGELESSSNMKQGHPELVGEGNKSSANMLVGDNFYAGESVNTMRTGTNATTEGNVITFGMAVDKSNGKKYAQYITDIKLDLAGDYALELKDANVIGHTIIDDMLGTDGKPKTATIVELKFDGDVRSGYNSNSTDNANVDNIVSSILNKHIKVNNLDTGKYTTIVKSEDKYVQNLVADSEHISFSNNGETFNVLNTIDKQYAYKTANGEGGNTYDTVVVLVDGILENGKSYDINLATGSIRAVYGGDVGIEVGDKKIVGIPVNIGKETTIFNISEDVFIDSGLVLDEGQLKKVDYAQGPQESWPDYIDSNGNNVLNDIEKTMQINNSQNSVGGGGNPFYTPNMFKYTFKNGASVTAEEGFVMEVTTKRICDYNKDPQRYEAHSLMGKKGDQDSSTYGYVLYVTDVANNTEHGNVSFYNSLSYETEKMSALLIISTKDDKILCADGNIIDANRDYRTNTQYSVNSILGKLYFRREKDVEYTFKAIFKDNELTLQILDDKGAIVPTFAKTSEYDSNNNKNVIIASNQLETLENGYKVTIPPEQLHKDVIYNQIGVRAGGGSGDWNSGYDKVLYNKNHGFVIKKME